MMDAMEIKILELELSEKITEIPVGQNYSGYRILLRYRRIPAGWLFLSHAYNHCIAPAQIHQAIKEQLSHEVVKLALADELGMLQPPEPPMHGISVVVCTRNRSNQLEHCLKGLFALQYPLFEIVVVDNAPDNNDTYTLVSSLPVRYIREDRPGLDWARNCGIAESRYDLIAFTDDDATPDPHWLEAIAKTFDDPEVMAATGYIAPARLETRAQQIFELNYGGMGHGFTRVAYRKKDLSDRRMLWASHFGVGANMAFRRNVFSRVGLFDVALDTGTPSAGGGDIDMFLRIVAQGHLLVYNPEILVWHLHRLNMDALQKQIIGNGRGFGCYLITCFIKRRVKRKAIIQFLVFDWLLKWNLKNLVKVPTGIPRSLSLAELMAMLTSPVFYLFSRKQAKRLSNKGTKEFLSADQI